MRNIRRLGMKPSGALTMTAATGRSEAQPSAQRFHISHHHVTGEFVPASRAEDDTPPANTTPTASGWRSERGKESRRMKKAPERVRGLPASLSGWECVHTSGGGAVTAKVGTDGVSPTLRKEREGWGSLSRVTVAGDQDLKGLGHPSAPSRVMVAGVRIPKGWATCPPSCPAPGTMGYSPSCDH